MRRECSRDRRRNRQSEENSMNTEEMQTGLASGRLHPFPLLQHLAREGDGEGARFVAKVGPEHLHGKEKLHFRGLVRELVPEALHDEDQARDSRSKAKQEERASAVGAALQAKVAFEREKGQANPLPPGQPGGWNLPLDVPK